MSKVLDYFETDKAVDARKVAVQGHSRAGKAALVAMAYDERFLTGYISSSGESGAKLHRRKYGEVIENIAALNEYHWMAGNFLKYTGRSAWVDAKGTFLAGVGAGPVYRLLGKKNLGTTEFPTIEAALVSGEVGFRQHAGGHTPGPNWPVFLDFAAKYFNAPNAAGKK
jgi:(4-O-methyl)-D-glucuronate---lignin esterase